MHGKSVYIQLTDSNKYSISSKLDIGVHKYFDKEQDETMRENTLEDVNRRLTNILNNRRFKSRINTANNNWLEIPINDVIENVLEYFNNLTMITQ